MPNKKENKKSKDNNKGKNEETQKKNKIEYDLDEVMSEGTIFTTAEILDISEGVDSDI